MKAQIFSIDLVIALSIFLGIIMLGMYFLLIVPETTNPDMQMKANSIASKMVASGLGTEGVIDCEKLATIANQSYDELKTQFGVNPYEIWVEIPNITTEDCPSIRRPIDVVLIIDRSGSMEQWPDPQKLENAKSASKTFVAMMNESWDQAGVASFSLEGWVDHILVVTDEQNKTELNNSIDSLTASGNTAMGDGIISGTTEITSERGRNQAAKVMILLSDGQPNRVNGVNVPAEACHCYPSAIQYVLEQTDVAKEKGITIYTISLGTGEGAANRTLMQQIASKTGGMEYFAPDSTYLPTIFETIAERVVATSNYGQVTDMTSTNVVSIVRIVQLAGKDYKLIIRVYRT